MTIKELKVLCDREIKQGNGDMEIWLSNDDEGNGFHMLFYPFLTKKEEVEACFEMAYTTKPDGNICILG